MKPDHCLEIVGDDWNVQQTSTMNTIEGGIENSW